MLAAVGFITVSILFVIFAATFRNYVIKSTHLKMEIFTWAYYSLALAFAAWGIAAVLNDVVILANAVIMGNILLLFGTLCMIYTRLVNKRRFFITLAVGAIGAALITARINMAWPEPYMLDGVLIFNSPQVVSGLLAAIFVLIWLPVNIHVAHKVAAAVNIASLSKIYVYIYSAATLSAVIFLSAERLPIVILSFAMVAICLVMLVASNVIINIVKRSEHAE